LIFQISFIETDEAPHITRREPIPPVYDIVIEERKIDITDPSVPIPKLLRAIAEKRSHYVIEHRPHGLAIHEVKPEDIPKKIPKENEVIPPVKIAPKVEEIPKKEIIPEVKKIPEEKVIPEVEEIPEEEVVPEVEIIPEKELVPEVEEIPEDEVVPEVEEILEEEIVPEVEEIPEEEIVPEVEEIPEEEIVPEVEEIPEEEVVPEVEEIPEEEVVPEVEEIPEEEVVPEVEEIPEEEIVPEIELVPEEEIVPEVEIIPEEEIVPVEVIPEEEVVPEVEVIPEVVPEVEVIEEPVVKVEEIIAEVKPEEIRVPEIIIEVPKITVKKEIVPEELRDIIREVYTLCPRRIEEEKPAEIIPCKYGYPCAPVKRAEMHVPYVQKKPEEERYEPREQYEIACRCKPRPTMNNSHSKLTVKCPKYNNAFDNHVCKVNGSEQKKNHAERNLPREMEESNYAATQLHLKDCFNKPRFREVSHSRNIPPTHTNFYRKEEKYTHRNIDIPRQPYENCRCKHTAYNNQPRMSDRNYRR